MKRFDVRARPPGSGRVRLGWLYRVRLWLGVIVGIQLLLWTAGGLFMTANPIAKVRGETLRRAPPAIDLRAAGPLVAPAAILRAAGRPVERIELGLLLAIRTRLWRWHDLAWGLHILDLGGREDRHHPVLIGSAGLALLSVLSGLVLIVAHFRYPRS